MITVDARASARAVQQEIRAKLGLPPLLDDDNGANGNGAGGQAAGKEDSNA